MPASNTSGIDADVVVAGAGVAGLVAALRARAGGARVVVVGKAGGQATMANSGAVDVADDLKDAVPGPALSALDRGAAWEDAVATTAARLPRHPYARLGAARVNVKDAVKFLVDAVPSLGLQLRTDGKNHVVATALGTVKRAAAVPRSQLLDLAELPAGAVVGVVEFKDLAGFNARPVVEMLRFTTGLGAGGRAPRFIEVVVPRVLSGNDVYLSNHAFARALDDEGTRAKFLAALQQKLSTTDPAPTALLMPPALTSAPSAELLAAVDKKLGRPLRELLALPPSLPGERLLAALRKACAEAGVDVKDGSLTTPVVESGRVVSVDCVRGPEQQTLRVKQLVLASGRFFGGGLVRDHSAREALLGLPVVVDGNVVTDQFIGALTGDVVDAEHAIFRAGVAVDDELRPIVGKRVAYDNVVCAGTVIAGFDPARDGAALGVSVFTAWLAGAHAAAGARA